MAQATPNPDLEVRVRTHSSITVPAAAPEYPTTVPVMQYANEARQYAADGVPYETDPQINPGNYLRFVMNFLGTGHLYQKAGVSYDKKGQGYAVLQRNSATGEAPSFDYVTMPQSIDDIAVNAPSSRIYLIPLKKADEKVYGSREKDEKKKQGIERAVEALKSASDSKKKSEYVNQYDSKYSPYDTIEVEKTEESKKPYFDPRISFHEQVIALAMANNRDSSPEVFDNTHTRNNPLVKANAEVKERYFQPYSNEVSPDGTAVALGIMANAGVSVGSGKAKDKSRKERYLKN
ncbi:hypothetical protein HY638_01110 [Candidatus Woesearchaeota archaeon]|nr:hypothetical protein [Candidatus Woesearchaeota archaeon]